MDWLYRLDASLTATFHLKPSGVQAKNPIDRRQS